MRRTPKPNGYGSWIYELHVVVKAPYDQILKNDGWEVISTCENETTFLFKCQNTHKGEDETALYYLYYSLPSKIPDEGYVIDWNNSAY